VHAKDTQDTLTSDLFGIYEAAGRNVTYVDKHGKERPYWANRFRQAVQRAMNEDAVLEFVERLMRAPQVSRGFEYLRDADRLDLTVEALVVDKDKPYHSHFAADVVQIAGERLSEHSDAGAAVPAPDGQTRPDPAEALAGLAPGATVDVRVTAGADGTLSFALI